MDWFSAYATDVGARSCRAHAAQEGTAEQGTAQHAIICEWCKSGRTRAQSFVLGVYAKRNRRCALQSCAMHPEQVCFAVLLALQSTGSQPSFCPAYLLKQTADHMVHCGQCMMLTCEKNGLCWSTFAKCAACPPSCSSVSSAVLPLPSWLGVARLVKLAYAGCHLPSGWRQAGCSHSRNGQVVRRHLRSLFLSARVEPHALPITSSTCCGYAGRHSAECRSLRGRCRLRVLTCGQWQKPLLYLPCLSHRSSVMTLPL